MVELLRRIGAVVAVLVAVVAVIAAAISFPPSRELVRLTDPELRARLGAPDRTAVTGARRRAEWVSSAGPVFWVLTAEFDDRAGIAPARSVEQQLWIGMRAHRFRVFGIGSILMP